MPRSPKTKTVTEKTPTEQGVAPAAIDRSAVPKPPPITPYQPFAEGGKPTYLTDERRVVVLDAIRKGMPIAQAVALVGVGNRTWYKWLQKSKDPDAQPFWHEFGAQVEQAKAEGMMAMLDKINKAAEQPQHWTAAQYRLAVMDPEHFGKSQTVTVNLSRMSEEQFNDALAEAGLGSLVGRSDEEGALTGGPEAWLPA